MKDKEGTDKESFATRFMRRTEGFQRVFGPADHGDVDAPVVHRHDDNESASDEELATFSQETDSDGHPYAVRREDQRP